MTTAVAAPAPIRFRATKRRAVLNLAGITWTVDPGPARTHLRELFAAGAGWNELRAVTGCSFSTLYQLAEGHRPTVTRDVAVLVLAVRIADVLTPTRRVPAVGSIRRVRALYRAGHLTLRIAAEADIGRSMVCSLASAELETITAVVADGITRTYERLAPLTGPSTRNRNRATAANWRGPDRWHPEDLDVLNLDVTPDAEFLDPIAIERAMNGDTTVLTRTERLEVTRLMTERGDTAEDIAARIDVTPRTVTRWRSANGWAVGG